MSSISRKYYVYGLFENNTCFYIGKGCGARHLHHFKQFKNNHRLCNRLLWCKLKSLESKNITPTSCVLRDNLTEAESYQIEQDYINLYGRKLEGGSLCNIVEGGNHPPSYNDLENLLSEDELHKLKESKKKSFSEAIYKRNKSKVDRAIHLMSQGVMIKDIALELNVTTPTIRSWLRKNNIKFNYSGKINANKLHLQKLSQNRRHNKIPITAKTYKIQTPSNTIVVTQRLVVFCKEHNLDYANLRQTFNGKCKQHKGYAIVEVIEQERLECSSSCS